MKHGGSITEPSDREGGNIMTTKEFVLYLMAVLLLSCSAGVTHIINVGFGAPFWLAFLFGVSVFYILLRLPDIYEWIGSKEE